MSRRGDIQETRRDVANRDLVIGCLTRCEESVISGSCSRQPLNPVRRWNGKAQPR